MGFIKTNNQANLQTSTDMRNIFVGRTKEVEFFIREILEPEEPTYNIISIYGIPGVGKSTLLTRFINICYETDFKDYCLTAQVDEMQSTTSYIMEKFAEQIRIAGYPLVDFEQALHNYNDDTLPNFRTSQGIERKIFLEKDTFSSNDYVLGNSLNLDRHSREGMSSVLQNFEEAYRHRQLFKDIERKDDPISGLTDAFINDLNRLANTTVALGPQIAKHSRRILLFFDSFEQLAKYATPWLLKYFLDASINPNIVLIVSGELVIEQSIHSYYRHWQKYKSAIHSIFLDSFTKDEACEYLNAQGITDSQYITTLLSLSDRLPASLSLLASSTYGDVDVTKNVVDNFLRRIPEDESVKRKLALEGSLLSRPFNQDDLKAFTYVSEKDRPVLYRWLCEQSFVHSNPLDGRHSYRDQARNNFSRHLRQISPDQYQSTRKTLASYYQQQLEKIQTEAGSGMYKTTEWLELVLALSYQLFLSSDEGSHINAIEKILDAYMHTNIKQDGEIIRFLRGISEDKPTNMANADARRIANYLTQYIETSPNKHVQEFLAATSFFIEKVSKGIPMKPLLLARIYRARGGAYFSQRKFQLAIADFNQAIGCNPSSVSAYMHRGQVYYRLKDYNKALADLDHAIQLDSNDEMLFILRGQVRQNMGCYEDALCDFERVLELSTKPHPIFYILKGQLLYNMGKYQEASDPLIKGLAGDPEITVSWLLVAQVYLKIHPYQDIPRFLKAIPVPKADSVSVVINRAAAIADIGHHEEAVVDLAHITELEPENPEPFVQLGIVYNKIGYYEHAIESFTRVLEIDSKHFRAMLHRSQSYCNLNNYTDALHDLNSLLGQNANNDSALFCRSQVYRHLRQYNESMRDIDAIIKNNQDFEHKVLEEKGKIWKAKGKSKEALDTFVEGLKKEPECEDCWEELGEIYGTLYSCKELPRLLREVPVPDKEKPSVICRRGRSMFAMRCYEEALLDFSRAIEIEPGNEQALLLRSRTYVHFDAYQKALEDLNSIKQNNEYVSHAVQEEIGEALLQLGKNEQAFDTFIDALKTKGMCARCWKGLVMSYEMLNDHDGTVQWLRKFSVTGTSEEATLPFRAQALVHTHHYEAAIQILVEAIELKINDFKNMLLLSEIYNELERYEESLEILTKILKFRPNNVEATLKRGKLYCLMNQPRKALQDFDRAIRLDPGLEHEVQEGRGIAFYSLQRYREAIRAFSQALGTKSTCDECWQRLANTYEASFDKSTVPNLLKEVPILNTNKALAIASRAEALRELGYYHEALIDFKYAFDLDEIAITDYSTSYGLVFSYLGYYAEAIKCYKNLSRRQTVYRNLYNIAVVMVRWKGFPEAQEDFDVAHEALLAQVHTVNYPEAFYGLSGLTALTGNNTQALEYLHQAILFGGAEIIQWMKRDIAWLDLRSDERFNVLIANNGKLHENEVSFYWEKSGEKQKIIKKEIIALGPVNSPITLNSSRPKAFLCCSPDDKVAVQDLYHRLVADGIDAWFSEKDLLPGQDREMEIEKSIRSSDAVVICLSSNIQKNGHFHKQISYALRMFDEIPAGKIFLIPVKLEECELPEDLRRLYSVNLFDEEGYERLIKSLRSKFIEN